MDLPLAFQELPFAGGAGGPHEIVGEIQFAQRLQPGALDLHTTAPDPNPDLPSGERIIEGPSGHLAIEHHGNPERTPLDGSLQFLAATQPEAASGADRLFRAGLYAQEAHGVVGEFGRVVVGRIRHVEDHTRKGRLRGRVRLQDETQIVFTGRRAIGEAVGKGLPLREAESVPEFGSSCWIRRWSALRGRIFPLCICLGSVE